MLLVLSQVSKESSHSMVTDAVNNNCDVKKLISGEAGDTATENLCISFPCTIQYKTYLVIL